jgi:hypothetical protein
VGILSPKKLYITVTGRDKSGNIVKQVSSEGFGFVTGSYSQVDAMISKLDVQYPGLEWEYEVMKD